MSTYYISRTGVDSPDRDGATWETAWASLAYTSKQVPAGDHTIQLGPGNFVETETARPKSGVQIAGTQGRRKPATSIIATGSWPLALNPTDKSTAVNEYLINLQTVQNVSIKDLILSSRQIIPLPGPFVSQTQKIFSFRV